jgi:hypothetical protein
VSYILLPQECHIKMHSEHPTDEEPILENRQEKNQAYGCRFYHRTESVVVVDAKTLLEPFRNQTSFVVIHRPILLVLELENPFSINYFAPISWKNKMPSLVAKKSIILINHRGLPIWRG